MAAYPANELPSNSVSFTAAYPADELAFGCDFTAAYPADEPMRSLVFDDGRLILTYRSFTAAYPADELCFFFVNQFALRRLILPMSFFVNTLYGGLSCR